MTRSNARSSAQRITMAMAALALATAVASPASAQRMESPMDCKLPGGCGTSDKPGGVELKPSAPAMPMTRGVNRARPAIPPAADMAPAAAAPIMAAPPPLPPVVPAKPAPAAPPALPTAPAPK